MRDERATARCRAFGTTYEVGPRPAMWTGLAWRAVLILVAATAAIVAVTTTVTATLGLAAVVAVAERVARHRGRGLLDLVLVAVGGTVSALIALGLVLNYTPWGLTGTAWAVGAGLVGIGALVWCAAQPVQPSIVTLVRRGPRPSVASLVCTLVAGLVLTAAVVMSIPSAQRVEAEPLRISATPSAGGLSEVTVYTGSASGRFDLVQTTDVTITPLLTDIELRPGQELLIPVRARTGRTTVELRDAGTEKTVRELVLDQD